MTAGLPVVDLGAIEESVSLLLEGRVPYEFRTTVVAELHTAEDVAEIARWIAGAEHYALQQFVDSGDLLGEHLHAHPDALLFQMKNSVELFVKKAEVRGVDFTT